MTPNDQSDNQNTADDSTNTNDILTTPGTEQPGYQRWIARIIIAALFFNLVPNMIGEFFPATYEQAMFIRNSANIVIIIFFVITLLKMLTERRPNAKN